MHRSLFQARVFSLLLIAFLLVGKNGRGQIKPSEAYDSLFIRVQLEQTFQDSKKFPDLTPLFPPEAIMRAYKLRKTDKKLQLSDFVADNFDTSLARNVNIMDTSVSMMAHIDSLWGVLTTKDSNISNTSLIPLPEPYIRPGGRFREAYYWDTYFTMLGLELTGRDSLINSMLDNFTYLIDTYGFIPNGNRTYYLSRSQPPFFAEMLKLALPDSAMIPYLPYLINEYEFWMKGSDALQTGSSDSLRVVSPDSSFILNRYYDNAAKPRTESYREDFLMSSKAGNPKKLYRNIRAAAESGWDFSSRWFEDKKTFLSINATQILPVDLNCLLYNLEKSIADILRSGGNLKQAQKYDSLAGLRSRLINDYFWNEDLSFFFDYNFKSRNQTGVYSLAGIYPLYFKMVDSSKAERIKEIIESKFLYPGGLVSTMNETGEQWDFPNGWAPLHWMAVKGLLNYGHDALAIEISRRWLRLNKKVYENTGRIVEKYNVVDTTLFGGGGEYPLQDGFGWTNGVYLKLNSIIEEKESAKKEE